ncbi:MAG: methyltransferase domain-containing protein [Kineosporiaceae bacterium]
MDTPGAAAQHWADALAAWRIPEDILAQAPQSPWIHPVELFTVDDEVPDSPSHALARAALGPGGSVLDIGCGGGRAAFAITPPATAVVGVDHQQGMLEAFAEAAERHGVGHTEILGDWPEVAAQTPVADVAVAHHVAYNVADLAGFACAAGDHARSRVVFELPDRHPLSAMAPLWRHFWNLERPDGPTADDALAVLREAGLDAHLETWEETGDRRPDLPLQRRVEFTRVRLCLPADRDHEVAEVLAAQGPPRPRRLAALWWDVR